jgi:hypothetical protein
MLQREKNLLAVQIKERDLLVKAGNMRIEKRKIEVREVRIQFSN